MWGGGEGLENVKGAIKDKFGLKFGLFIKNLFSIHYLFLQFIKQNRVINYLLNLFILYFCSLFTIHYKIRPLFTRGIKHDFPFINICKVPREVLKTEGEARRTL